MSYKSVFLAFFGFLFVCSLFASEVTAQETPTEVPTPIFTPKSPVPGDMLIDKSIDEQDTFYYVRVYRNSICWGTGGFFLAEDHLGQLVKTLIKSYLL